MSKKLLLMFVILIFTSPKLHSSPTIWNGPTITFTKANYADWTLEPNQDRISSNVWITRKDSQGVFNIFLESGFEYFDSPLGTEWAFGTTVDYASLDYNDWLSWCGGYPPSF